MTAIAGRTVLVTGSTGFVGRHVVALLNASGARVHGLGNEAPKGAALEAWHTADLGDAPALAAAVAAAAPEFVVHLAAQASPARSFKQPVETFRVNTLGTWQLLQAVRTGSPRARVLVVGTADVYGPQPEGTRVAEDAPFRPVSPYALSKAAADMFAELAERDGVDVVRTRSFAHTGPGQDVQFAVPSWAHQIATIERGGGEPVIRVGNLEVTRDLSDVRDVARAYLALLDQGRSGAAYNVCRGEGVPMSQVLERLRGMSAVRVRVEQDSTRFRPSDVPYLVGDPAAIERDTGWRAATPLETTLAAVLEDARSAVPRPPN